MQPDQPLQPTDPMAPQPVGPPMPTTPEPAAPVAPGPMTPNPSMAPGMPVPVAAPSPMESPAIDQAQPVGAMPQPAMDPMAAAAAPFPAAPSPVPEAAPAMVTPPMQPMGDSSQPGYVPPANPMPMAPMSGNTANSAGGKSGKIRIIIAVVVALFFVLGGGLLLKDLLFSGSKITKESLVDAEEAGVAFKHPKGWSKVETTIGEADAIYTEAGVPLKETDQSIQILTESLPIDIDTLSESEINQLGASVEKEMNDISDYEDVGCKNPEGLTINKTTKEGYKLAYTAEVKCSGYEGRNVTLKAKVTLAASGKQAHTVWVFALEPTWEKSGDALDEILKTFKPA